MDDGERTAATAENREKQSTIYELLPTDEATLCTLVLVSFSSARSFLRNRSRKFTHDNDERRLLIMTKQVIDPPSGLTMTDEDEQ